MWEGKTGKILFSLFKVAVFLGVGSGIGFFLGLAYASHLYGTPPVVTQIQNWIAGDSLYEGPVAVDQADKKGNLDQGDSSLDPKPNLMSTPVAIIPKLGACIGFGMALSIFAGSFCMRIFAEMVLKKKALPGSNSKEKQDQLE